MANDDPTGAAHPPVGVSAGRPAPQSDELDGDGELVGDGGPGDDRSPWHPDAEEGWGPLADEAGEDAAGEDQSITAEEAAADFDELDDEEDWIPVDRRRKGLRVAVPTLVLALLVAAAGAFWGGAALEKHHAKTSTTSTAAAALAALASRFGGTTGSGTSTSAGGAGTGGAAGAGANATRGTLTDIQGSTIYLTDANGNLVKVTVTPSTTVSRSAKGSLGQLTIGDTVIVLGSKAADGSISATSVIASAPGVTATGGFRGLGGGGGGTGGFGGGGGGGSGTGSRTGTGAARTSGG
jgi:hypothetical protein